jgi:leader peptidase (prepilin peptidase)/N-methyltransferase
VDADPLALIALPPWGWAVAALWGALWGSFFNVAIHRVGLYESVMRPRSRCPSCGRPVRAVENVPILSWLFLRGRCRGCGVRISLRYPLVEALGVALALAVYWRFVAAGEGATVARLAHFFVYFAFGGTLLVLAGIDLDHLLIPDRITYPAVPVFFVAGVLLGDVPPLELLLGAVIGYGVVALVAEAAWFLLKREGMGYGDAKLLMLVGALCGWLAVPVAFVGGALLFLLVVPPLFLFQRKKLISVQVPFGPFIAAVALAYALFGREILRLLRGLYL